MSRFSKNRRAFIDNQLTMYKLKGPGHIKNDPGLLKIYFFCFFYPKTVKSNTLIKLIICHQFVQLKLSS